MAESEIGADKSEEPTEKRLRESREKGQIARSKELNTLAVTLGGFGGMLAFGGSMANAMLDIMRGNFSLTREVIMDERSMSLWLGASGQIAVEAMAPKLSRMNPLAGLKRMFSTDALVELLKALAKFTLILLVGVAVLSAWQEDLLAIVHEPIEAAFLHSITVVGWSALWMSCGLILIAAVDVPFQLWSSKQKLMMTKQEVRDEYKDSEGKPEVKQRIRQLQREMAERRMMQSVPDADVVITN